MLLDCTLESLQLFRDFVSGSFGTDFDYMELRPATLHMGD